MARLLGGITTVAALALALGRLHQLLAPAVDGPPWLGVMITVTLLGATITAGMRLLVANWLVVGLVNIVCFGLVGIRIIAPDTLSYWFWPGPETWETITGQLEFAWELLRNGSPPVLAIPGMVASLALIFWGFGSVAAAGLYTKAVWLAITPPMALYLELTIIQRNLFDPWWGWAMVAVIILAFVALALTQPSLGGRTQRPGGKAMRRFVPLVSTFLLLTMVTTAWAATRLENTVSEEGILDWRSGNSFGIGRGGGTSFNRFVGLQQSINSLSDQPMFYARLSEDAPTTSRLYWNLITLDVFDGINWSPSAQTVSRPTRNLNSRWEDPELSFQGETQTISARILIDGLSERLLPSLYSTTFLDSEEDFIFQSLRVREDGSLLIDISSRPLWDYQITAQLPQPDYNQLATVEGELSPLFAQAARLGAFPDNPTSPSTFSTTPELVTRYLDLPEEFHPELTELARTVTTGATTKFEQALVLEAWFRDSSLFSYSTQVSSGHSGLNLLDWLTNPDSTNYRVGYCEQYATSLAVLARTLNIPSRVVLGFAPGTHITQTDGSTVIRVTEQQAHSWVELWMDGQGWIRFDPTPRADQINPSTTSSQIGFDPRLFIPAPEEPDSSGGSSTGNRSDPALPEFDVAFGDPTPDLRGLFDQGGGFQWWWLTPLLALLVVSVIPLYKWGRWLRRKAKIATGDVVSGWEETVDRLSALGNRIQRSDTPTEIAVGFSPELLPLATSYSSVVYGAYVGAHPDSGVMFDRVTQTIKDRYGWVRRAWSWLRPRSLRPPR